MFLSAIKNPYLVLSVILILVPSIFLINFYQGYWWDEAVYLGLAKSLSNGYYQINQNQEMFRPPFLPFMLSFFLFLGNLRLISVLFAVASVIITYLFAKELYGKKIAIIAALFLSTSHLFIFYSQKVLAEPVFCALFTLALYAFYKGVEKNKKYLPLAGVAAALCFLTRYPGFLLIPIFSAYIVLRIFEKKGRGKILQRLLSKELALAAVLFIIILIPWLWHNHLVYNDLLGAFKSQQATLVGEGPWYYYLRHAFEEFGFAIIFSIPAFAFMLFSRKNSDKLLLLSIIFLLLFFSFFVIRKDMRYLIAFASVFYIFSAYGVQSFGKWIGKEKIILIFAALFALFSFSTGLSMCYYDLGSGASMVSASLWLKNNTAADSYIIADNYPVINYFSERKALMYPGSLSLFEKYVDEYNITYCVVDNWEPTTPEYVKSFQYPLAASFESGFNTVLIYRLD